MSIHSGHLRGFALLGSGQAVGRAMTFLAITYLARVLGVEMFGAVRPREVIEATRAVVSPPQVRR